jgi:hypothetical protein
MVDDKKIRPGRIGLDQEFAVPRAESLGNHLARLRMYGGFSVARAYTGTSDALTANVINVVEDDEIWLVCGRARVTCERNGNEKQAAAHTI